MKQTPRLSKTANRVITALMVFSCLSSMAAPAWADRDDRHREDWHSHAREAREWHHRHWHNGRTVYDDREPYVTYAPPVIVEPPPPVVEESEPGVNIVVPLNFR